MSITQLAVYSHDGSSHYDLSDTVKQVQWSTDMSAAGTLAFDLPARSGPGLDGRPAGQAGWVCGMGDTVVFAWDGSQVFRGWVFTREYQDDVWKITCYDSLRYLKTTGAYAWGASSSSERLARVCSDAGIRYAVVDPSPYRSPAEVTDGSTYYDMVSRCVQKAFDATGSRYYLTDSGDGVVEHRVVKAVAPLPVFADGQGVTQVDFTGTIDSGTANRVRVVYQDTDGKTRRTYVASDPVTAKTWGWLDYAQTADGSLNPAQLQAQADSILKRMDAATASLRLTSLGFPGFKAGQACQVSLSALEAAGVPAGSLYFATQVTHSFEAAWSMDCELVPLAGHGYLGDNQDEAAD